MAIFIHYSFVDLMNCIHLIMVKNFEFFGRLQYFDFWTYMATAAAAVARPAGGLYSSRSGLDTQQEPQPQQQYRPDPEEDRRRRAAAAAEVAMRLEQRRQQAEQSRWSSSFYDPVQPAPQPTQPAQPHATPGYAALSASASRRPYAAAQDATLANNPVEQLLDASLRESRVAEEVARASSRALARELAAARETLHAARGTDASVRGALASTVGRAELRLDESRRSQQLAALKADEAQHTHRLLDAAQRDLRRREEEVRQKDAHIRHLENTLRLRQDAHADLKLLVDDLRRDLQEKQETIASLQRTQADNEERSVCGGENGALG